LLLATPGTLTRTQRPEAVLRRSSTWTMLVVCSGVRTGSDATGALAPAGFARILEAWLTGAHSADAFLPSFCGSGTPKAGVWGAGADRAAPALSASAVRSPKIVMKTATTMNPA
jgi:hypothetical protein